MAPNGNGEYFYAEEVTQFEKTMKNQLYKFISHRYILSAELNMDGKNYLESKKYPLQLTVKTGSKAAKGSVDVVWPNLTKSNSSKTSSNSSKK